MPRLSRLFVYPIKSCRGIEVDKARLTPRGLDGDRRYMLVDAEGHFLTQRQHGRMALLVPAFQGDELVVSAPGRAALHLPRALDPARNETCRVQVWQDQVEATLADADTNVWFSEFMGFACGLVYLAEGQHRAVPNPVANFDDEVSFADGAPLLLISEPSLDELNRQLARPVGIERFRPNLVVTADRPHAEDSWATLAIGTARFDVAWPCSRCVLTTVDPATGERDPQGEPMVTLLRYRRRDRKVYFGQNLIPRALGTIAVGDACVSEERPAT